MAKVLEPCLAEGDPAFYERRLEDFLVSVFDRPLAEARRRCRYGHQAIMGQHLRIVYRADQKLRDLPGYGMTVGIAGKLRNVFGK